MNIPYRVVACVSSWAAMGHLTLDPGKPNLLTLCGKRWLFEIRKPFNPKFDCQQCKKMQEALA
jgi:hypothetical protein